MGTPKQRQKAKNGTALSATELISGGESEARQQGRRLILKFLGGLKPELDRIEFRWSEDSRTISWQQCPQTGEVAMRWTPVPQALALIFLEYLCLRATAPKGPVWFHEAQNGEFVGALGNALSGTGENKLQELFVEWCHPRDPISRVGRVFGGKNFRGKDDGERWICIQQEFLPPDCIEVFWTLQGQDRINNPKIIRDLNQRIRTSLGLPVEQAKTGGEGRCEQEASALPATEKAATLIPPPEEPTPPVEDIVERIVTKLKMGGHLHLEPTTPTSAQTDPQPQSKPPEAEPPQVREKHSPPPPPIRHIDPWLFEVPQTDGHWPDDMPLIALGPEDAPYTWTLKNAFEGVLILGATGSGKTSGSGDAIAESFLRSGFGGLVLTVKEDEAEHWRRLCAYCGREADFVAVRPGGPWKLNVLAYEAQRPGRGSGLANNLVSFCRNLLGLSSRHDGPGLNEQFWRSASDALLSATFDLFLLAGAEITFDGLANFIQSAPTERLPSNEEGWLEIPTFGSILSMANQCAETSEDRRILQRVTDYWFKVYPGLGSKTRTSITLGVFSMLDAFRGRDIPDIISSDTNITPESIMAGQIVVLDLPLNAHGYTGLIIQSAWKYLFQTALKREERARDPQRRPVFLWEDEGQHFFSDHDHHFQATARSSRVSRVLLSQNVHNFYMQFGQSGREIANSVFGNLNTKIFHKNTDPETNQFASSLFGTETRMRTSFSHQRPPPAKDMWDSLRRMIDPPSTGGTTVNPHVEPAVRPEEFALLRNGGPENDFLVDAYITWLGLISEEGKHFTLTTFIQNQSL